ncbi:MAG TPA: CPBP family glutamic-type intramembrane protease [Chitinophagaceae bacterium]
MKSIISYIGGYFYELDKRILALVSLLTGILIFLNYYFDIDRSIAHQQSFLFSWMARYIIFLIAFGLPYLLYMLIAKRDYFLSSTFRILLLIAPAIFSLKVALDIPFHFSDDVIKNDYWNHVLYWPVLLCIISLILFIVWKLVDKDQPFYGTTTKNMNWKPYWLMLLIMVPLIAAASTQPDFQAMYPKLNLITGHSADVSWWQKLLFELSYGSDFIGIELFFRGFLILAFIKWAGKDTILPMACFYCTIHFGKPLGECISSYFGGLLLGIVVSNTRSIWGGLMVHLGIAWLMELGGYLGNL